MKPFFRFLTTLLLLCLAAATATAGASDDREVERKVNALMRRMTLAEKFGQLQQLTSKRGIVTGPAGEKMNVDDLIRQGLCGSLLSIRTPEEIMRLQRLAVEESRLGIPILFGHDIIHGCRVIFPENLGVSCSWDMEAVESLARVSAEEASAFGIAWTFSPMCDISADPRWSRVSEGSGEDPYLGSAIARAMVRGYQGDDLAAPNTVAACVKHFAAYGAPQAGRDYHTVDMSERMFRDRYLPPYRAALDEGAVTVMTAFNDFDGTPCSCNRWLMQTLLRDELGFKGLVVSDHSAIYELVNHGIAADRKHAAELALNAHVNMNMVTAEYIHYGEELVREGSVAAKLVDRMCREVLTVKFRLGLFDDPYRYGNGRHKEAMYRPENLAAARDVARKSMVLLKNDGNTLPLDASKRIALIGPFADSRRDMLGAWPGFGERERCVTFLAGLRERFGEGNVLFAEGCKPLEAVDGGIEEALRAAESADIVLLTLGLPYKCSGEASSMATIGIPEPQRALLDAVAATGKPVVILLATGRAMDIAKEVEKADAVLLTWHSGTMGGHALADVLSGDYNPSGRLTMTFPLTLGQVPIHYNAKWTGRPRRDPANNAKYTSRYLFTPNEPLYPFGYGLSYTTFEYSDLNVLTPEVREGESVRVSVKVTNTGDRAGEEVVQLYLRDMVASTTRPMRELKGFSKVALAAGESGRVEFTITPEDMAFYRADCKYAQERGDFKVYVGHDSNASLEASFTVK